MNPILKYGNLHSGMMAMTTPPLHVQIGTEATILNGRDREPARVMNILFNKNGKVKAFVLQAYYWLMDSDTEGYAKEIHWDEPKGQPQEFKVVTHGRLKGTVKDAFIGRADAFYDRSF